MGYRTMSEVAWTVIDAARSLRCGDITASELVEHCWRQIQCSDGDLHAWVHVDRVGALAAAEEMDATAARGEPLGPLHGIPVGIKDIIDVAGMPTRAGSVLRRDHVAPADAPIVEQLRRAGAVILGKTVTTEFACFDPPPTVNPWDPSRTPGGSSSGSAVAVARGMCLAALGSQTGGSIIRPATYCGVVGYKPTKDAWSTEGVVPVSSHLDHIGPMTVTAADAQYIWHAVSGAPDSGSGMNSIRTPTIAMPRGFFRERADADMLSVVDSAVTRLVDAGARIEQVDAPQCWAEVLAMHRRIMAVELAAFHRSSFQQRAQAYSPRVAGLIKEGLGITSLEYDAALEHRREFTADMERCFRAGADVWLTPATTSPAPGRETTGDPSFNSPWSYCGFPAVSIPCGRTDGGLPVGLQLIGLPGNDDPLLQISVWCESVSR